MSLRAENFSGAMEKDGPGSELTFDYLSGEEEFPHLKQFWRNVRKGGPKEKRLRKQCYGRAGKKE